MLAVVLVVLTWWAAGFHRYAEPNVVGFSTERRVTFTFTDTKIDDALRELFPDAEIAGPDDFSGGMITLKVKGMKEYQAMRWISELSNFRLVREGNVIRVSERKYPEWIDEHYDAVQAWINKNAGFKLWPNR